MCGRFTLQSPSDALAELFEWGLPDDLSPSYNVAPTQAIPVFRQSPRDASPEVIRMRWGLIPFFAKDSWVSKGAPMINARSETVAEKPFFRQAFRRRRCLVPADGFLEWKRIGKTKQPYHITMADARPFAMAGLWEQWQSPTGELIQSCTILTTPANDLVSQIHDRMPAILHPQDHELWTNVKVQDRNLLQPLLQPFDPAAMTMRPVSMRVNNARNNVPECLADQAPPTVGG
ncbi:MAG: SOS response-associated peptidase [Planctomycetota bacterium]